MNPRTPRGILIAFTLFLVTAAWAPDPLMAQENQAFGVSPGSVVVEDAIAGQTYHRELTLQNRMDDPAEVQTQRIGTVGAWTSVDPAGAYTIPAQSDQELGLTIDVPDGAPNGTHHGELRLTALAGEGSGDNGFQVQHSVTVLLTVHLGGDAVVSFQYMAIDAQDIELGDPPRVTVQIVNTGNVQGTVQVRSLILEASGGDQKVEAIHAVTLSPGEDHELEMDYGTPELSLGTYIATAGNVTDPRILETEFKVAPPGTLGKDLLLRELLHPPRLDAGEVMKIEAPVANTGSAAIARAHLMGEVYQNDRLVGTFQSEPRNLQVDQELRLVAFYTPEREGRHVLIGTVHYDGFETPPKQSLLTVEASGGSNPWLFIAPLISLILFIFILFAFRRRRSDEKESRAGRASGGAAARLQTYRRMKDHGRRGHRPPTVHWSPERGDRTGQNRGRGTNRRPSQPGR